MPIHVFPAKYMHKYFLLLIPSSLIFFYFLFIIKGQFSINLAGTGMKISSTAKWLAQGSYASVIIHRSQVSPAGPKSLSEILLCCEVVLNSSTLNSELYEVND